MDFVSADRSRDAEFQAGLKNYNFGVSELNRNITKDITDDKNTERQTDRTIDSDETQTRILDATGGASAIASAAPRPRPFVAPVIKVVFPLRLISFKKIPIIVPSNPHPQSVRSP